MKYLIILILITSCGSKREQVEKQKAAEKFLKFESSKPKSGDACSIIAAFSIRGLYYAPELVTWSDAVNNAPAGKRLITRGEGILLWDAGELKVYEHKFSTGQSWTASIKDGDDAYALNTVSGWLDYSDKDNVLSAIYVDK